MHADRNDELNRLFVDALAERLRRQDQLEPHAERIQERAAADPRWLGRARLLRGYAAAYQGRFDDARSLASEALAELESSADPAGPAAARDLLSTCALIRNDYSATLAVLTPNLALDQASRSAIEWSVTYSRLSHVHERLGDFDEALRWHYRTLTVARASGDPACEAIALGGLGGLQLSLQNFDDAATLLDSAWRLLGDEGHAWAHTWSVVAMNRLMVLAEQARFDEALPLAETILIAEPGMPPGPRAKRKMLLASVFGYAGDAERAQRLLDEGLKLCPPNTPPPVEWVWTQAHLWNRAQRHADVSRICDDHLQSAAEGQLVDVAMPEDLMRLHNEATIAHEALGNHAAALASQRAMIVAERELVSAAARARRTTLQIQYELDSAQRDRDEAQRREHSSALEQARLGELNSALRAANEAKTRFLASASHDLRQPVQALTMYMAALKLEGESQQRHGLMNRMDQSLHALSSMFDVLLDVSRLDAGLVNVHRGVVRLDELLARLVDEHLLRAEERRLKLRLRLPSVVHSLATHSDAVLLERCLRNLIDNALKYTVRGGVVVRLRAMPGSGNDSASDGASDSATDSANGWRIEVRDTGPGIAPELQEQVFEEFFQVGNEERDRAKGLGLGLAIVRRMTGLLGHRMSLGSRLDRGCCFSIDLPRVELPAPGARPAGPTDTTQRALGLIVIDDDAQVRDSLAALLERWGHRVMQGASADDVLRAWQRSGRPAVDAAIVDLRLRGGATGLEMIQQLRHELRPALPALVVTGDIAPLRLQQLSDAAQDWLPKPLAPMRLRSWLGAWLERHAGAFRARCGVAPPIFS